MKINGNAFLFSLYLICFGIFGSLTPSIVIFKNNFSYHLIFEILILLIPILYYFHFRKFKNIFYIVFINYKIIIISLSISTICIYLYLIPINYGLFSDEQTYVISAHAHGLELITNFKVFSNYFFDVPINTIVRIISFFVTIYIFCNI